jgi:ATP-dependent Lhr-like helicase
VLASRISDYSPAMLDELTAAGEVLWAGGGSLPGSDGWVSLHLADRAPLTLPEPDRSGAGSADDTDSVSPLHAAVLEALGAGGGFFFRQLSDAVSSTDDKTLAAVLWELVWAGRLSNDTLAPLRALVGSRGTHRPRRAPPRSRLHRGRALGARPTLPSRSGPPTTAGRWSLLPPLEPDATRRAHASAEALLERHGVVTRGAVLSERVAGGFAGVYRVLSAFEETGRCRRGYFVAGLGAAQFGTPGAVDRLRSHTSSVDDAADGSGAAPAVTLAATDPANPFGAALPWPERPVDDTGSRGHRPGRKAGALVVLVDGQLVIYVERGGRTLLTFTDDPAVIEPAVRALANAVRQGVLGKLSVERADGEHIHGSPLASALEEAGFFATPRGLRLRS